MGHKNTLGLPVKLFQQYENIVRPVKVPIVDEMVPLSEFEPSSR